MDLEDILVKSTATVRETIKTITKARSGIAVVAENDNHLVGVITDGDIRRELLEGLDLSDEVAEVANTDPVVVHQEMSPRKRQEYVSDRYSVVPVVNDNGEVIDIEQYKADDKSGGILSRRVCVVGLGYVGLTLAVTLADVGHNVIGFDKDGDLIKELQSKEPHFYEKGLKMYLEQYVGSRLKLTRSLPNVEIDTYIMAIGTPVNEDNRKPDISQVKDAAETVGSKLKTDDLVILRSTVPVGTARDTVVPVLENKSRLTAGSDFDLVVAPERTVEGRALEELRCLPQIIGGINRQSIEKATRLFDTVTDTIVKVDSLESAEMAKIIDNTYRDVTFGYANEIAVLCEQLGLNVDELVDAVNLGYERNNVPKPSPGVGGACLSKDPYILMSIGDSQGVDLNLVRAARSRNESMPERVANRVVSTLQKLGKDPAGSKILILGFAFKGEPETSDTRHSPTKQLINALEKSKFSIVGYDPIVSKEEINRMGARPVDLESGFRNADAVIVMTNHSEFSDLNIYDLIPKMNLPGVYHDGWGLTDSETISTIPGIKYQSVGHE